MDKETREFYDKLGICICCGKEKRAEGHAQCPRCLERGVLYQAKKRDLMTPEMKAEANTKRREAYNRVANRLCCRCGEPIEDGNDTKFCNACRERQSLIAHKSLMNRDHVWYRMAESDFGGAR